MVLWSALWLFPQLLWQRQRLSGAGGRGGRRAESTLAWSTSSRRPEPARLGSTSDLPLLSSAGGDSAPVRSPSPASTLCLLLSCWSSILSEQIKSNRFNMSLELPPTLRVSLPTHLSASSTRKTTTPFSAHASGWGSPADCHSRAPPSGL